MKKTDALDAMEFIGNDIIDEADRYKPTNKSWIKWGSMAASICLLIGAIAVIQLDKSNTMTGTMTGDPIQSVDAGDSMLEEGTDSSGASHTVNAEADNNKEIEELQATIMIDHFDKSLNDIADMAINNGCFELSNSLKVATEKYGDTVSYRVVVEVFQDGTVINSGSSEVASEETRLANEKYIVAHEKYEDTGCVNDYFTIHAKVEQLLHFSINDKYGYYISFYSEYAGLDQPKDEMNIEIVPSVNQLNTDQPVDESNPKYMTATEYPEDILDIQEHISSGMVAGELSFVHKSAIYEDPLRIEVSVDAVDEKQLEQFMAEYDPMGKYVVIKSGVHNYIK